MYSAQLTSYDEKTQTHSTHMEQLVQDTVPGAPFTRTS